MCPTSEEERLQIGSMRPEIDPTINLGSLLSTKYKQTLSLLQINWIKNPDGYSIPRHVFYSLA
jgi:hypothetical protein